MLEGVEPNSATARALKDWLAVEIAVADIQNRSFAYDHVQTQCLRARIAAIQEVVDSMDPEKPDPTKKPAPTQNEAVAFDAT